MLQEKLGRKRGKRQRVVSPWLRFRTRGGSGEGGKVGREPLRGERGREGMEEG